MPPVRITASRRVWLPAALFLAFASVIVYQLVDVQVLHRGQYRADARNELITGDEIYAQRGAILDRNGNPLALSVATWDFYINSRAWADDDAAVLAAQELGPLLDVDPATVLATVRQSDAIDVRIARDVEYLTGIAVIEAGITGVIALQNTDRVYPEGDLAASILGFTGDDNVGLVGLESYYNDLLQGKPGRLLFEQDSSGEPIPFGMRLREAPRPGSDLVLTIDRNIQRMAEKALEQGIEEHGAKGGAVLIVDPSTLEILAAVSRPSFTYSELDLDDPEQLDLLRNRMVSDLYEPGSVMKVITAAAAIDAGVVTPNTTYVDTGIIRISDAEIRNWNFNVYGTQTMTNVLEQSINTGAVFMAQTLGGERFHDYLAAFGFGRTSGLDFEGEAEGLFRHPWDAAWSPVDLATQSFGQAIGVTPVQMITAIAAAINGGNLLTPHLLGATIADDGTRTPVEPEVRGHPITPNTSATIRSMLRSVIDVGGGAHPATPDDYTAGGKSGTANVPVPNGYDETVITSFVGFAPANDPEVLIMVKLDENTDRETGTAAAGPIVADLVDEVLHYLNVPPEKSP